MPRVNTNDCAFAFSIETSVGTAGTTWFSLEPNDIGRFGAETRNVARRPISGARQLGKGTPVSLTSGVNMAHDMTMSFVEQMAEGFLLAEAANENGFFRAADVTSSGFTISAATSAQAAKFQFTSGGPITLVHARGYATTANNGLHALTSDLAASGTAVPVTGLTVETAPTNAEVQIAGIRAESGDLDITVASGVATITSGNNSATNNLDFTTVGVQLGQIIHVGGLTSGNQFSAGVGYIFVTSVAAGTLVGTVLSGTLATDPGTGEQIDLLFGRFWRPVATTAAADDNRYSAETKSFEAAYPDVDGGTDAYEYPEGNYSNLWQFNVPLEDKATLDVEFVGTDTPTPTTSRASGAASPIAPVSTTAYNTSSNIVALETDLLSTADTCIKQFSIAIRNNVSPDPCIGTLGAVNVNVGLLEVGIEADALFTSLAIPAAIRANTTARWSLSAKNDDGFVGVLIPTLTLGNGAKSFPQDEAVRIQANGTAHLDPVTNISVGISTIPAVP